ncbi:Bifunctional adenosine 5'-phosphosulfate phosphorylase/adenylylsulfatase [Vigna angularis]|uniref:Bifunctional adenosine 5'-phosphosulfate phosphorylase/adenylylsulfatase n=1 Tax=Phaseolus angularis TaxID=3914 RepID=A0A8T0JJZ0_PHAAN|nr:Bifunctional adenosine 5'-phosphosulfate phosphorylase/adenylylsulfatase [Vigna angularis]
MAGATPSCVFCAIAAKSTPDNTLLHSLSLSLSLSLSSIFSLCFLSDSVRYLKSQDDKVVAFQDINPSAFRHYLVVPVAHIPTVKDLQRKPDDHSLVNHMLEVGKTLLLRDAPQSQQYRFGFHQPPLNSVNHLHLHCLALPYTPRWRSIKYLSFGPLGFIEAEKFLEKIKPSSTFQ